MYHVYHVLSVASGGVFSLIFRNLWSAVKTREGIFSRFCTMVALWVYIKPCIFFLEIWYSFVCRAKMVASAREGPAGHSRAEVG